MAHLPLEVDDVTMHLLAEGAAGWTVVTMGAIAMAESGRDGYAVNVNHSPGQPSHRSLDIGLFQINTFWNPNHTIRDLLGPVYNVRTALAILRAAGGPGDGYNRWNTYRAGAHLPFLHECRESAQRLGVNI